ncbi:uncharacterized protein LOC109518098 isoform X2 [Hippocampus comes]|uniref:uncharacterized protein LOC109518098 isoform X2 n=1 Tax=Hippocampus comes TaxID=109280 RepID=UPI00094F2D31|nr:PREDICTED: uncharacterized protein LOC109518098 isoform X2 [Hippocampus comes]
MSTPADAGRRAAGPRKVTRRRRLANAVVIIWIMDMLGNSIVQCAIATTASLASLSLLGLLCLRCKRKPKTIHEEAQIYNPHTFRREGSRFAVTRSKTVMKANQMTPSSNEGACPVYENEQMASRIRDADPTEAHYANLADAAPTDDDADDYENSEFLAQKAHRPENGKQRMADVARACIDFQVPRFFWSRFVVRERTRLPFLSSRGCHQVSIVRGHHPCHRKGSNFTLLV